MIVLSTKQLRALKINSKKDKLSNFSPLELIVSPLKRYCTTELESKVPKMPFNATRYHLRQLGIVGGGLDNQKILLRVDR